MLLMLVALNAFLWTMTGFSLCWATHRQRGLEADRLDAVLAGHDPRLARRLGGHGPERRRPAQAHCGIRRRLSVRIVGAAGFEPATSCSQSTRASQAALRPV